MPLEFYESEQVCTDVCLPLEFNEAYFYGSIILHSAYSSLSLPPGPGGFFIVRTVIGGGE